MANFITRHIFTIAVVLIIGTCIVCICTLSGFRHETEKFKTMLLTLLLVLLFNYLVCDVVMLTLEALLVSCFRCFREGEPRFPPGITRPHSYTDSLRQRLISQKGDYEVPWKHRDERLNTFYRKIAHELFVFVMYFLVLWVVVMMTRDQLLFYNTFSKTMMLGNGAISDIGLSEINRVDDVYKYIKETLIQGFHEGIDYRGKPIGEPGWLNYEMAKLLGVVRLRLLRFGDNSILYLPGWKEPYIRYHYLRKYWRIYGPWLPLDYDEHSTIARNNLHRDSSIEEDLEQQQESEELVFQRSGEIRGYSEYGGYATLLARNINNSLTVAKFLEKYGWMNSQTAALFIDFTLYNVDANIFSVVSIMLEQTPFGDICVNLRVNSCKLLLDLNAITYSGLVVMAVYLIVLVHFLQTLVVRLWHQPWVQLNGWNVTDIVIVLLNISIVPVVYWRERQVLQLLDRVGEVSKLQFVDFRGPAQLDYLLVVLVGFLICLTTVRLWRIMQFARVFRLFTTTLSMAKWPMLSSSLFIAIILFSFSISSCIINGSQSESFNQPMKSIRAGMSVAIGIGNDMGPQDLSHGGYTLGMLQYSILMVLVAIVLVNMFVTLIIDYFTAARQLSEMEKRNRLNFFEFLLMEYAWIVRCVCRVGKFLRCSCCQRKRKQSIREYMEEALDRLERRQQKEEAKRLENIATIANAEDDTELKQLQSDDEFAGKSMEVIKYELHMRRMQQLGNILRTQMELMERQLMLLEIESDWDEEAAVGGDGSGGTTPWLSKER